MLFVVIGGALVLLAWALIRVNVAPVLIYILGVIVLVHEAHIMIYGR